MLDKAKFTTSPSVLCKIICQTQDCATFFIAHSTVGKGARLKLHQNKFLFLKSFRGQVIFFFFFLFFTEFIITSMSLLITKHVNKWSNGAHA